jgi:hypothetical protein
MSKLQDIVQNVELEEHLIFYVGLRHMSKHRDSNLDPWLPVEFESLEGYYRLMCEGIFEDLRQELQKKVGISQNDPDFDETLEDAIKVVVARHGMVQIVMAAREFLRYIQDVDLDEDNCEAVFDVKGKACTTCKQQTIPLQAEDLPAGMRQAPAYHYSEGYGYCLRCKEILTF